MPEPEQLGRGSAGLTTDGSRRSNLEPEQRGQGGYTCCEQGADSVAGALRAHTSVICLQRPSLPTVRLNK